MSFLKNAQPGQRAWCLNPDQGCHTHVKYIKLLRNSTEKKKDKKLPEPSEADGLLQYQRTAVSVFLSLCLRLILGGKPRGAKKCLRFHSDPRNEITNPIITWILHGSRANRLCWVIYLILSFSLFNLSLPWWDYSLRRTVYHRKTY